MLSNKEIKKYNNYMCFIYNNFYNFPNDEFNYNNIDRKYHKLSCFKSVKLEYAVDIANAISSFLNLKITYKIDTNYMFNMIGCMDRAMKAFDDNPPFNYKDSCMFTNHRAIAYNTYLLELGEYYTWNLGSLSYVVCREVIKIYIERNYINTACFNNEEYNELIDAVAIFFGFYNIIKFGYNNASTNFHFLDRRICDVIYEAKNEFSKIN